MNAKLKNTITNYPRLVISLLIVAGLVTTIGLYSGSAAAQNPAQINSITTANYAYHSDPWPECDTVPMGGCMVGYKYFGIGDEILFAAEYNAPVTVTGNPTLALSISGTEKLATFKELQGTRLIFAYTVVEGEEDHNGVSVPAGSINLNGGTVQSSGEIGASLSHSGMSDKDTHRIDGVRPTFLGISEPSGDGGGPDGVYSVGETVWYTAKFSEPVYARTGGIDWGQGYKGVTTGPLAPKLRVQVGKNRNALTGHNPPTSLGSGMRSKGETMHRRDPWCDETVSKSKGITHFETPQGTPSYP